MARGTVKAKTKARTSAVTVLTLDTHRSGSYSYNEKTHVLHITALDGFKHESWSVDMRGKKLIVEFKAV